MESSSSAASRKFRLKVVLPFRKRWLGPLSARRVYGGGEAAQALLGVIEFRVTPHEGNGYAVLYVHRLLERKGVGPEGGTVIVKSAEHRRTDGKGEGEGSWPICRR